jgi:hypothetical protein
VEENVSKFAKPNATLEENVSTFAFKRNKDNVSLTPKDTLNVFADQSCQRETSELVKRNASKSFQNVTIYVELSMFHLDTESVSKL